METNQKIEKDTVIEHLQNSIRGIETIQNLPGLLIPTIEDGLWKEREVIKLDYETVEFNSFEEFVRAPFPEGLNSTPDMIKAFLQDIAQYGEQQDMREKAGKAEVLLDEVLKRENGGDRRSKDFSVDNVNAEKRPDGNSRQRALRKLRQSDSEFLPKVIQGKISAHKAMIKEGFRNKRVSISLKPKLAAKNIEKHFSNQAVDELIGYLENSGKD